MKNKPLKQEEVKIKYSLYCPLCNKEIKGYDEDEVIWNHAIHMKSCKQKKEDLKNAKRKSVEK